MSKVGISDRIGGEIIDGDFDGLGMLRGVKHTCRLMSK